MGGGESLAEGIFTRRINRANNLNPILHTHTLIILTKARRQMHNASARTLFNEARTIENAESVFDIFEIRE